MEKQETRIITKKELIVTRGKYDKDENMLKYKTSGTPKGIRTLN